ncbi:hypothetical protein K1T71_007643 [Dendrolimus kikuchii]|uniref:Uncharacterized protein n=1 Tax=Dendrolimus kikuchii TaxID=765133 RepID=A0ACC1CXM5_9NEOP|nr:hypothetical protein K1T71_007643 [Dendrolimus kikuchii]
MATTNGAVVILLIWQYPAIAHLYHCLYACEQNFASQDNDKPTFCELVIVAPYTTLDIENFDWYVKLLIFRPLVKASYAVYRRRSAKSIGKRIVRFWEC